jgi:hypothetical protein
VAKGRGIRLVEYRKMTMLRLRSVAVVCERKFWEMRFNVQPRDTPISRRNKIERNKELCAFKTWS